jgi:hypothetical protein
MATGRRWPTTTPRIPRWTKHGSAVFWRDGTLHVIDADLKPRELSTRTVGSRKR